MFSSHTLEVMAINLHSWKVCLFSISVLYSVYIYYHLPLLILASTRNQWNKERKRKKRHISSSML